MRLHPNSPFAYRPKIVTVVLLALGCSLCLQPSNHWTKKSAPGGKTIHKNMTTAYRPWKRQKESLQLCSCQGSGTSHARSTHTPRHPSAAMVHPDAAAASDAQGARAGRCRPRPDCLSAVNVCHMPIYIYIYIYIYSICIYVCKNIHMCDLCNELHSDVPAIDAACILYQVDCIKGRIFERSPGTLFTEVVNRSIDLLAKHVPPGRHPGSEHRQ